MSGDPDQRLKELDYLLPPVPEKAGLYRLVNVVGNRCVVCGHGPFALSRDGTFALMTGRVGDKLTVQQAKAAARHTAICMLASLRAELGSLSRIGRLVRTFGLVNAEPSCAESIPLIIDGFSEVMRDVFGPEFGVGARSAVGAGTLPFNIPVEVEAEFELKPVLTPPGQSVPVTGGMDVSKGSSGGESKHIYERLFGMPSIINCIGSFTSLGGSRMPPEASKAMVEASEHFVDLNRLQRECGKRIAKLCRCPTGYGAFLTTGASAGLAVTVAACIAGTNPDLIHRLPKTSSNDKRIVIMDGGNDRRWAQSIETTGAQICYLGTEEQPMYARLLSSELSSLNRGLHACIVFYDKTLADGKAMSLEAVLKLAKAYGVPVVVDAAAQVPPRSNLWHWTERGVDAVIFSGGKQLSGPQTSGIILAKEELLEAMRLNTSPNECTVCRPMKCSKEDMVGLVTAVEKYMQGSDDEDFAHYRKVLETVTKRLSNVPGISRIRVVERSDGAIQPSCIPRLYIDLNPPGPHFSEAGPLQSKGGFMKDDVDHGSPLTVRPTDPPKSLAHRLANGQPCVAINTTATGVIFNPQLLRLDEAALASQRLAEECQKMVQVGELQPADQSKL
ncbi:uncharacterized protein LOC135808478 [Sycon ciliatum]|uniref:uncharacterized protein LOC135808478 n=1 Tax=Sycon ciliatum TaxID=27933 RepID=UPI0031F6CEFC